MRTPWIPVAALLAITGCKKVDNAQLEKDVVAKLESGGVTGAKVACPSDVEAKNGKKFTCTVALHGKNYDYDVAITNVDGSKLDLETSFRGGTPFPRQKLLDMLTKTVKDKVGADPAIDCGTDALLFATDDKIYCTVTAGAHEGKLRIDVKGTDVTAWHIE